MVVLVIAGAQAKRVKCRFCDWEAGDGFSLSGRGWGVEVDLLNHVRGAHPHEYARIWKWIWELGLEEWLGCLSNMEE